MNIENIRTEFPAMPEDVRARIARTVAEQTAAGTEERPARRKGRAVRRTTLLALAAALLLSATALAVAASRIDLTIFRYQDGGVLVEDPAAVETAPAVSGEAEGVWADEPYNVDVSFEEIDGEWIGLGSWYPQTIPEGYVEAFVSDAAGGESQRIAFENAAGRSFDLVVKTAGPGGEVGLDNVIFEQAVTIGAHSGTLFRSEHDTLVVWTDETRGLGFCMRTDDPDVDLLSVARSVSELDGPLTPTRAADYGETLAEIGDYAITALPAGYEERSMTASDLSSDWYRYVRRWYENAAHEEICLSYETFAFADDNPDPRTPETILAYYGAGASVSVNGLPGGAAEGKIVWVDWDRSLVFTITAEGFSADELLVLAESVAQ